MAGRHHRNKQLVRGPLEIHPAALAHGLDMAAPGLFRDSDVATDGS
jgi:hypothetical protein